MSTRALLTLTLVIAVTAAGCSGDNGTSPSTVPSANVPFSSVDLRVGTGAEAQNGRRVSTNYALWLYSAGGVDNKGQAIQVGVFPPFILGGTDAIAGYQRGVLGMRVGGLRRIIVPPDLAYGSRGSPPAIPGNATIVFEIELTAVQ